MHPLSHLFEVLQLPRMVGIKLARGVGQGASGCGKAGSECHDC